MPKQGNSSHRSKADPARRVPSRPRPEDATRPQEWQEAQQLIHAADHSDAAARIRAGIELRARQRALRAAHDARRATGDPKVLAALEMSAKHHREAARRRP